MKKHGLQEREKIVASVKIEENECSQQDSSSRVGVTYAWVV